MAITTESEISEAVLGILDQSKSGIATIRQLRDKIPSRIKLTEQDRHQSSTRPNEEIWEQRLRNIVSHKKSQGNIISLGLAQRLSRGTLAITKSGRLSIGKK